MARPVKPEPMWTDLTYERWASVPANLQAARDLRALPAVKSFMTVLVNERPSTQGITDASFILGYESALARIKLFLDGVPPQAASPVPRVSYAADGVAEELSWTNKPK